MSDDRRLGTYDAYLRMSNPLVIEDKETGEWIDLSVSGLVKLIRDEIKNQQHQEEIIGVR
jgi:hypothetical protein